MPHTLWTATISHIGSDSAMMIEEGVVILFGEPVPPALADVALVHTNSEKAVREIAPGDVITIGDATYTIDDLGELANNNLNELGHIVLYVNKTDQTVLPGAVIVSGATGITPTVGDVITITGP